MRQQTASTEQDSEQCQNLSQQSSAQSKEPQSANLEIRSEGTEAELFLKGKMSTKKNNHEMRALTYQPTSLWAPSCSKISSAGCSENYNRNPFIPPSFSTLMAEFKSNV